MKRLFVLVALTAGSLALADAELVLQDGRRFKGVDVRRAGDQYLLELDSGEVLTFPAALVRGLTLSGDDTRAPSGLADTEAAELSEGAVENESGPTGVRRGDPETLVGHRVVPPRASEQLEALGEPARFPASPVESAWKPRSSWDAGNDVLERSRSSWQADVVDSGWTPRSAYRAPDDVLAQRRSRWRESIIDPGWRPTDGFRSGR